MYSLNCKYYNEEIKTNLFDAEVFFPNNIDPYYYFFKSDQSIVRISKLVLAILNYDLVNNDLIYNDLEYVDKAEFDSVFDHVIKEIYKDDLLAESILSCSDWMRNSVSIFLESNSLLKIRQNDIPNTKKENNIVKKCCKFTICNSLLLMADANGKLMFRATEDKIPYTLIIDVTNDFINKYLSSLRELKEYILPIFINDRLVEEICIFLENSGLFHIDYDSNLSPFHILNSYSLN